MAKKMAKQISTDKKEFLVIGACLPRMGTTSLKAALSILLRCNVLHMTELSNGNISFREQLLLFGPQSTDKRFREILLQKGYLAGLDVPICFHVERALRMFPHAKVILATRDIDAWSTSMMTTIYPWGKMMRTFPYSMLAKYLFYPYVAVPGTDYQKLIDACENAALHAFYAEYAGRIRNAVPAEKLLEYNVKDGWQPLCEFLKLDKPDVPFPRVNDSQAFQSKFLTQKKRNYFFIFFALLLLFVTAVLIVGYGLIYALYII